MAARVPGSSHRRAGIECQDFFACEALPGAIVAAVADGAGSAPNSGQGAEIAVRATIAEIKRGLGSGRTDFEPLLCEAALAAREAVIAEAREQGSDPATYASTLLALVVTPDGGAALQIGDGVIVVDDGAGAWCWVFWPQHGEYANTTYFLTGEDASERIESAALPNVVSDFALTTDGLERLVLHLADQRVHDPFFDRMFRPLLGTDDPVETSKLSAALEAFLASDQVASRTDDDLTLVLATRRSVETVT